MTMQVCLILSILLAFKLMHVDCAGKDQETTSSQEAGGIENESQVLESIDSVDNTREHKEDIGQSSKSMLNANSAPRKCDLPHFYYLKVSANNVDEPLRAAIENCMEIFEQLLNAVYHDNSLEFDDNVGVENARKEAIEWANLILTNEKKWINALGENSSPSVKSRVAFETILDPRINKKLDGILNKNIYDFYSYSITKRRAYMVGKSGPCDFLKFSLLARAYSILRGLSNEYKDPIHIEKYNTSDKMVSEQMTPLKFYYLASVCWHLSTKDDDDPAVSLEFIDHSMQMEKALKKAGEHFWIDGLFI